MNGLCLSVCLSLTLQLQVETASPSIRLAVLKSEWQQSWTTLRTVHAKVRRMEYDTSFHSVKMSEGTVAYEVNGRCKLALSPSRAHAAKVVVRGVEHVREDALPFTVAWNGDEVIMSHPDRRVYQRFKIEDCRSAMLELQKFRNVEAVDRGFLTRTIVNGGNWIRALRTVLIAPVAMMASPADSVPILFSDPATIEAAGFELAATKGHPRGLTAIPTTRATKRQFDRIDILFGEDGFPCATNMIAPGQTHNVVHVLNEIRINDLSQAAQAEFYPALDGLQLEEWSQ